MNTRTGEKLYECLQSLKFIPYKSVLVQHMVFTQERGHLNFQCQKSLSQWRGLMQQMTTHTGEKLHECSLSKILLLEEWFSETLDRSYKREAKANDIPYRRETI